MCGNTREGVGKNLPMKEVRVEKIKMHAQSGGTTATPRAPKVPLPPLTLYPGTTPVCGGGWVEGVFIC